MGGKHHILLMIYGVEPTPPPLTDQGIKGHILPLDDSPEMNNRVSIFI